MTDAKALAGVYGTVVRVRGYNGFGPNTVIVQTASGAYVLYGHMSKALVVEGAIVTPTTPVGIIGNLGGNYPIHLHVQISVGPNPFNGPFVGIR